MTRHPISTRTWPGDPARPADLAPVIARPPIEVWQPPHRVRPGDVPALTVPTALP